MRADLHRGLVHLGRAREGLAAVEFAVGAAFLILAFTALYDFGRASWRRLEVASAAQAGAVYAASNGFNSVGIGNAVANASATSGITATPAPVLSCGCPNGTSGITAATCGSTCAATPGVAAQVAGYYVTVNARSSYSFVFPYPYVTSPLTISASTVAKLQ